MQKQPTLVQLKLKNFEEIETISRNWLMRCCKEQHKRFCKKHMKDRLQVKTVGNFLEILNYMNNSDHILLKRESRKVQKSLVFPSHCAK